MSAILSIVQPSVRGLLCGLHAVFFSSVRASLFLRHLVQHSEYGCKGMKMGTERIGLSATARYGQAHTGGTDFAVAEEATERAVSYALLELLRVVVWLRVHTSATPIAGEEHGGEWRGGRGR